MAANVCPDELQECIAVETQELDELEYMSFGTSNRTLEDIEETYGTEFAKAVNLCLDPYDCTDPAHDGVLYDVIAHYLTVDDREVIDQMSIDRPPVHDDRVFVNPGEWALHRASRVRCRIRFVGENYLKAIATYRLD